MAAYTPVSLAPARDDKPKEALRKIAALLSGALSGAVPLQVSTSAGPGTVDATVAPMVDDDESILLHKINAILYGATYGTTPLYATNV